MTLFKYSLISDLHLDFPQPKTPYDKFEKNVVVAGDTMNGLGGLKFLQKLKNKGFNVFATHGNHEHYLNYKTERSLLATEDRFITEHPALHQVDDGLFIVLANGWYQVADPGHWFGYMNDGRYAAGLDPWTAAEVVNSAAVRDAFFLRETLATLDGKAIVVTHTAPCTETLDPRYVGSAGNAYYWSPWSRAILAEFNDKILVWNHGHTHASTEATVDGVRVVCNPRGYPRENPDWEPLTISVEL